MSDNNNNNDDDDDDDDNIPPIWLASLETLQLALTEGRNQDALRECLSLLLKQPTLPTHIKSDVKCIQSKLFIHLENYKQIKSTRDGSALYSYVLYRQKKYKDALEQTTTTTTNNKKNDDVVLTQHVRAQSMYRLNHLSSALKEYKQLLLLQHDNNKKKEEEEEKEEERLECLTNALAVAIANAIPYCSTENKNDDVDWLIQAAKDALKDNKETLFYDLAYNLGTFQSLTKTQTTTDDDDWLTRALEACQEQTDKDDDDLKKKDEMVPILINQSLLSSSTTTTTPLPESKQDFPDAIKTILKLSKGTTAAYSGSAPPESLGTLLQRTIWWYNKSILALQVSKFSECKTSLDKLLHGLGIIVVEKSSGKSGKKGNNSTTTTTTNPSTYTPNMVWWIAQCAIIEAHLQLKQQQQQQKNNNPVVDVACKLLNDCITNKISNAPDSSVKEHAMTMLTLHLGAMQTKKENQEEDVLKILQSLPPSTKERAGVAARIAYLTSSSSKQEEDPVALATTLLRDEKYMNVVKLLEPLVQKKKKTGDDDDDEVLRALYWHALSYVATPSKALQEWKVLDLEQTVPELPIMDDDELLLDPEEMEQRPLPLRRSGKKKNKTITTTITTTTTDQEEKKKQRRKNKESIMRRRAKLREEYLSKLQAKGRNIATKPDPERWIPKYERAASSRQRRGRGGKHVGSQGGVAERDALKLDVAARKKGGGAAAASLGPSTANLSVAGGQVKRGKKKR